MNSFINWVAVNNTLMIRIGFTAILGLLVIYVFRLFFLPKVNVVNDLADADAQSAAKTDGKFDEDEIEKRKVVEQKQAQYYTNEIEKLLIEAAKLKDQLMDTNIIVTDLKEKNLELTNQVKAAATVAPVVETPVAEAVDPEIVTALKSKVSSLEARLFEYEIIAEDISEIGQLRKEISELRKQAEKTPEVAVTVTESEPVSEPELSVEPELEIEPEPEIEPELVERLDEAQIADLIRAMEQTSSETPDIGETIFEEIKPEEPMIEELIAEEIQVEEPVTPSQIKLTGDKEVSAAERDMLDHFEEITKRKGS